ncbi:phage tail assembly chaperone [Pantoea agglomerans]|uniref:phage tail assembly chaperone n=1 Tax=Enterobacter agglomerans TaxID=549 RepID=UPI003C7B46AF
MSTKFTLQPKPTFKAVVSIPRAGEEDGQLTFTFKHMALGELAELEKLDDKTACDFLAEIVAGWALPEECTPQNISTLLQNYPGAMLAISRTYYNELLGHREKN